LTWPTRFRWASCRGREPIETWIGDKPEWTRPRQRLAVDSAGDASIEFVTAPSVRGEPHDEQRRSHEPHDERRRRHCDTGAGLSKKLLTNVDIDGEPMCPRGRLCHKSRRPNQC
jgi:hypothetical protein